MKIGIVNQPFGNIVLPWAGRGGSIDIWIYEVARRLGQTCDVIVYTRKAYFQKKVEYNQGVKYRRISTDLDEWFRYIDKLSYSRIRQFRNLGRILLCHNTKRPLFASKLYYLTYALQIAKDLRRTGCDIVHIHNFSQFVPIIRMFNPRIKIALHMHCQWLTQLDTAMIEARLRETDLIIGCSEYITKKICSHLPQFAERCHTAYNGVDVNHFACKKKHNMTKQNETKRLLFVGRVSPEKGLHVLLEAFEKVVEHYPQAHLEIVGSQSQLRFEFLVTLSEDATFSNLTSFYGNSSLSYFYHLQRQILSRDIASKVTFTGFISHSHIIRNYCDASIFVNSSFSEAFPLPIVEAMASGLPVIATRVGGIPEAVLDGKTGLLVDAGDARMLSEAMLRLLSDEDQRRSMGEAARRRAVELFSWEKIVEDLLRLYTNTCDADD